MTEEEVESLIKSDEVYDHLDHIQHKCSTFSSKCQSTKILIIKTHKL